jgi:signal transduction histidine kinase
VEQGGNAPNRGIDSTQGRSQSPDQPDGAALVTNGLRHDLRHAVATIRAVVAVLQARTEHTDVDASLIGIDDCARAIALMLEEPRPRQPARVDHIASSVVSRAHLVFACEMSLESTECWATVGEVEIERLLTNLVDNACRAAGPTGRVAVHVRNGAGSIVLDVGDSGAGFGAMLPQGGIGLSVVETVTRSFGGRITFAQSPLGGARISVELPEADELPASRNGRSPRADDHQGGNEP